MNNDLPSGNGNGGSPPPNPDPTPASVPPTPAAGGKPPVAKTPKQSSAGKPKESGKPKEPSAKKEPSQPVPTVMVPAAQVTRPLPSAPLPSAPLQAAPMGAPAPMRMPSSPMRTPSGPAIQVTDEDDGFDTNFLVFSALPSVMISGVVHALIVVAMAFVFLPETVIEQTRELVAQAPEDVEQIAEFNDAQVEEMRLEPSASSDEVSDVVTVTTQNLVDPSLVTSDLAFDQDAASLNVDPIDFGDKFAPANGTSNIGVVGGSGLSGRGAAKRAQMIAVGGGSEGSEKAVARALKWFANHQLPDGSWNFDHRDAVGCRGKCNSAGKLTDCRTGATGMALLPFLGAGHTHKEGEYKAVVEKGLYFLTNQMKVNANRGDLAQGGGSMYSHGIAAIVLCEAYGMTKDKTLRPSAQLSLNHTIFAQDPLGGGWRYTPKQPGDTSAVGWQLMALKSGHMSYLEVPASTVSGAMKFLDSVQSDGGARYGYDGPGAGDATSAVGLLSRMYCGWKRDDARLGRGVKILSDTGPSRVNMYYNYYATQVLKQYNDGEMWTKWNTAMRDQMIETQEKDETKHTLGSWIMPPGDLGTDVGGRHYCTSMATMILEVYYRHMPIYGEGASDDDFPL
jgi:hypothetical protein